MNTVRLDSFYTLRSALFKATPCVRGHRLAGFASQSAKVGKAGCSLFHHSREGGNPESFKPLASRFRGNDS
ncbi:MAG: hypothetical protein Q8J78_08090 [Moraxellaceae bacterium]|nr:hypothetical protein [Moraxellaceae bacterium]